VSSSRSRIAAPKGRLLAIDGYSLAFRAFFAIPPMSANGQEVNALFGFLRMLARATATVSPTHLVVALDAAGPTFRDLRYDDYKAGRAETPDPLREQLGMLRGVLDALRIRWLEVEGYEADDVLATLATRAEEAEVATSILTGDRDSLQLVEDPWIEVLLTRQGVSELGRMDEEAVKARFGVPPARYRDFAVLRGDKSDNLPGVPGIGEKTAARLLETYGSIDGILAHLDALPPRQRAALEEARERLPLYRELATLVRDVPLGLELDALDVGRIDVAGGEELLVGTYELRTPFRALLDALGAQVPRSARDSGAPGATAQMPELEVRDGIDGLGDTGMLVALAQYPGMPGRERPSTMVVARGGRAIVREGCSAEIAALLDGAEVVGLGVKELVRALNLACGCETMPAAMVDAEVLAYVLDPSERHRGLEEIARLARVMLEESPPPDLFTGAAESLLLAARALPRLIEGLRARAEEQGLTPLVEEIEIPLTRVLTEMERRGVAVDVGVLEEIGASLGSAAQSVLAEIHALAGDLNPNSPKQLAEVLFDRLGLTPLRKTKTGYSTDAAVLEQLRDAHPIVPLVLRFREIDKLRSTFYEGLRAEIALDGRIHATYNQTVARTGRISSERPNLQNIPVRSEEGRQFRRVFVAPEGRLLVAADYSQIELRILAHLSGDQRLIELLSSGVDVHTMVAASIYGVPASAVTPEQRSVAKMVAYGLSYGMESYGLGQRLGIPAEEADRVLKAFFVSFPQLRRYRESVVSEARERGYTTTLLGRRRYLPELRSPNRALRQGAERQAINAPTQGLAADLFKKALVALAGALDGHDASLVLQVHDEVVVETAAEEAEAVAAVVRRILTGVMELAVPLVVDLGIGPNWEDAKARSR
jgi:DNA polymerase-1